MPMLNVVEGQQPGEIAAFVWWAMVYPHDPDKAFESYVRDRLTEFEKQHDKSEELVQIPSVWLKALLAGSSDKELRQQVQLRSRQGVTAGCLLMSLRICADLGQPISLNTAIEFMTRSHEMKQVPHTLGATAYGNKPEIHSAWKAMRNVAHLWAAACLGDWAVKSGTRTASDALVKEVMGLAAPLLDWAHETHFAHAKDPIIDRALAWEVPSFIARLPLGHVTRDQLETWAIESIDRRKKQ